MSLVYGVLAALVVIFLLAMVTVRKPKFGIGLSIVTLILISLAVIFYSGEDNRLDKQKSRIPVEQIILTDTQSRLSYGNTYKITGKLENRSTRYMLASIMLDIQVYACSNKEDDQTETDSGCDLLQQKQHKVDTRMKAETSRSFETYVIFDALNGNKGNLKWDIKVLSGIGR